MHPRKDYLKLKLVGDGNREVQKELFVRLTHRELESQRLQPHQTNQWADQAQREKISLRGELEYSTRVAREVAKKLKNYEEFVAKKQIEQDKQELMNYLCSKRGIHSESVVYSN